MTLALTHTQIEAEASATNGGDLGLSLIRDDLTEVIGPDPVFAQMLDTQAAFAGVEVRRTRYVGPLRRLARRAVRVVVGAFRHLRAAALRSDVAVVAYTTRLRRAVAYAPRHSAARRWYGVQRSTSRRNSARVVASRTAAREGELPRPQHPPEFISWVASFAETIRAEDRALRYPTGRHFICS